MAEMGVTGGFNLVFDQDKLATDGVFADNVGAEETNCPLGGDQF